MSSFFKEPKSKAYPNGRWVLQWNIYINGKAKKPISRLKRVKKLDIPKLVRIAVEEVEQATQSGVVTLDQINRWIVGYPELGIDRPLISAEDAKLVWPGYRDHVKRTGIAVDTDMTKIIDKYIENAKNKTRKDWSLEPDSLAKTKKELVRVLNDVCVKHPNPALMTENDYYEWWNSQRDMHSPSTTNKKNYALKNFFSACVDLNLIDRSPYNKNRCPTIKQTTTKPRRVLTEDEAKQTIEILNTKYDYYTDPCGRKHPMHGCIVIAIYFGLYCGLRTNEMRWLEWDALVINKNTSSFLYVQESKCAANGEIHTPKDHEFRTLGISDKLKNMIETERKRQNKLGMLGQYIIPSGRYVRQGSKWDKDQRSIGTKNVVISNNQFADSIKEFNQNEKAIYSISELPTYTSYRHTYATQLLRNNVDIATVKNRMGHEKIDTTNKYLTQVKAEDITVEENLPY